jgi:hypothetical protein
MMTDFGDEIDPEEYECEEMVAFWLIMYFYGLVVEGDPIAQPRIDPLENAQ